MTDIPQHIRQAMERLKRAREGARADREDWLSSVYPYATPQWYETDDLRTVAYWCIDQQREIDT